MPDPDAQPGVKLPRGRSRSGANYPVPAPASTKCNFSGR